MWWKRGNGVSRDSHSGYFSIVGSISTKTVSYQVLNNYCRKCDMKGTPCEQNGCPKNWSGSAKSMESAAVSALCTQNELLDSAGVKIARLVCDGDSSVAKAIAIASNGEIERLADVRHNLKYIANYLYPRKNRQITAKCIKYLQTLAGCAVKSNVNNPEGMRLALAAIPYHAMGKHETCGDWCKREATTTDSEETQFSKYLDKPIDEPGSDTFDDNLKLIQKPFNALICSVNELAPNGSTQANESSHNTITSKCSKRLFHSGTKSAEYRSAMGVLQRNSGVNYTLLVRTACGLTPGNSTRRYKEALRRKRELELLHKNKPRAKRRRKELQNKALNKTTRKEAKEGPSYKTGKIINEPDLISKININKA
jgi:hypothetical protein